MQLSAYVSLTWVRGPQTLQRASEPPGGLVPSPLEPHSPRFRLSRWSYSICILHSSRRPLTKCGSGPIPASQRNDLRLENWNLRGDARPGFFSNNNKDIKTLTAEDREQSCSAPARSEGEGSLEIKVFVCMSPTCQRPQVNLSGVSLIGTG